MRYSSSKSETTIDSLREAQTKAAKKVYFTKNQSSPTFLKITTSNFQEMILAMFRKFCHNKI